MKKCLHLWKKASAKIIKDKLKEKGVMLLIDDKQIMFSARVFSTIINHFNIKNNNDFCEKRGQEKYELFFSEKAISFIVDKIVENPRLLEEINKNPK